MDPARFDRDALAEAACVATGLDDFGEPTWQDGLDRLLTDLVTEARLHELGVEIVLGEIAGYLTARLGIVDVRPAASRGGGGADHAPHRHRRPAAHRHHHPL